MGVYPLERACNRAIDVPPIYDATAFGNVAIAIAALPNLARWNGAFKQRPSARA